MALSKSWKKTSVIPQTDGEDDGWANKSQDGLVVIEENHRQCVMQKNEAVSLDHGKICQQKVLDKMEQGRHRTKRDWQAVRGCWIPWCWLQKDSSAYIYIYDVFAFEGCQSLARILVCKCPVLLAQSVGCLLSIAPFSEITWIAMDLFIGFLLCPLVYLSILMLLTKIILVFLNQYIFSHLLFPVCDGNILWKTVMGWRTTFAFFLILLRKCLVSYH